MPVGDRQDIIEALKTMDARDETTAATPFEVAEAIFGENPTGPEVQAILDSLLEMEGLGSRWKGWTFYLRPHATAGRPSGMFEAVDELLRRARRVIDEAGVAVS